MGGFKENVRKGILTVEGEIRILFVRIPGTKKTKLAFCIMISFYFKHTQTVKLWTAIKKNKKTH